MEVRLSDSEMAALITDRHQHDVVIGKAHEEKQSSAASDTHAAQDSAAKDSAPDGSKTAAASSNASSAKSMAAPKISASSHPSKNADRQLQKAVEYLSTELARAQ